MCAAFLQNMKATVFAWQPQDSRTVAVQTCKTVKRQFHRNCETFSGLATIIGLRYNVLRCLRVHRAFPREFFKYFLSF